MKIQLKQKNRGFTIIEAIIAVFILSMSITAMLGLTASSMTSARYADNEITANYLLQEAVDSIRNSRDTIVFQQKNWAGFLARYTSCFSPNGCEILNTGYFYPTGNGFGAQAKECNTNPTFGEIKCSILKYDSSASNQAFYLSNAGTNSRFKRRVKMEMVQSGDGVKVKATIEWQNGASTKSQSLETILMNWQKD